MIGGGGIENIISGVTSLGLGVVDDCLESVWVEADIDDFNGFMFRTSERCCFGGSGDRRRRGARRDLSSDLRASTCAVNLSSRI